MDVLFEKHKKTIAISLSTIAALSLLVNALFKKDKNKLPMVPYSWPFLGSTLQYYRNPSLFAKNSTLNYGESFRVHLHGRLTTIVGGKDAAEVYKHTKMSFLASKMKYIGPNFLFPKGGRKPGSGKVVDVTRHELVPNLDIYGPRAYKKIEQIFDATIQDTYVVENLEPFIRDLVARANATALFGSAASRREDLIHTFKSCTSEISKEQKPGLMRLIFPIINTIYVRFFRPHSSSIVKHKQVIREAIISEIDKRKKLNELGLESEEKYLIDYLLTTNPGEVNDDYITSMAFVTIMLIMVGVHTTNDAVRYVLYQLVLHNEYVEELRQEQEEIFSGQPDAEFIHALSKKMVKLDSFIRESLRYRTNSFAHAQKHVGNEDIQLSSGEVIHPGEEVFINIWQIQHTSTDDSPYNKDLNEFRAFRYLDTDKIAVKTADNYFTFGFGKHACPGRWYAVHQIKGVLSVLLRNYDIAPVGTIRPPQGRECFSGAVRFTKRI